MKISLFVCLCYFEFNNRKSKIIVHIFVQIRLFGLRYVWSEMSDVVQNESRFCLKVL